MVIPSGGGKTLLGKAFTEPLFQEGWEVAEGLRVEVLSEWKEREQIEQDRHDDDSPFLEGGFDKGTTLRETLGDSNPWLERLGLSKHLDTGFRFLSNGEVRKALLLMALHRSPEALVFDEFLEGLDAASRAQWPGILEELSQHMSLLFLTSRQSNVPQWMTRRLHRVGTQWLPEAPADATLLGHREALPASWLEEFSRRASVETVVEASGLICRYGERVIFEGLHWEVRPGQHWLLTGPNGCGKTTLLSMVVGDHPQAYQPGLRILGTPRGSGESIWDIKKHFGLVGSDLQRRQLSSCTGLAVVCSGFYDTIGLYQEVPRDRLNLARDFLELFGLEALGKRYVDEMSYGELRLLLILRALVKAPQALMLDEPTQGLDDRQRGRVHELIEAIMEKTPCQILLVSHDPEERPKGLTHHLEFGPHGTRVHSMEQKEKR